MRAPGPLLAAGRDADVFEYDKGTVLRRSRQGRSLELEARTMSFLHTSGYPVPEVLEVSDDGRDLVMERVDGPTMVEAVGARPWTLRRSGHELAELHERLHAFDAPPFLAPVPVGAGTKLLHRDLHPLNVMLGSRGPVVIDWSGAGAGDPAVDVDIAWVLMAVGELPGGRAKAAFHSIGRRLLLSAFLSRFDRASIVAQLRDVVAWKVLDPHMNEREVTAMWALVDAEEGRA